MIDPPHHIEPKKMGGSNRPEIHDENNAITLCRECHNKAHNIGNKGKITKEQLKEALKKDAERMTTYEGS